MSQEHYIVNLLKVTRVNQILFVISNIEFKGTCLINKAKKIIYAIDGAFLESIFLEIILSFVDFFSFHTLIFLRNGVHEIRWTNDCFFLHKNISPKYLSQLQQT